ncbi:mavicyanin-like [Apium graveolens]|uniref:mavicyanin-like n=1 Tax=Apium graveolens TaxID=4045 RepID=UPI003D796CF0
MVTCIFVVACLFLATISSCVALDYTVGDSDGWGLGVDLPTWKAGKGFLVGDNLVFKYVLGHTLAEVNADDYTLCTAGSSNSTYNSGYTVIPLTTPGEHFFICTVTNHCAAGMKLRIIVWESATTSPPGTSLPTPPGGSTATTPPGTSLPTPPAGGSTVPQIVYSDAPVTPLSYGVLALLFLLL